MIIEPTHAVTGFSCITILICIISVYRGRKASEKWKQDRINERLTSLEKKQDAFFEKTQFSYLAVRDLEEKVYQLELIIAFPEPEQTENRRSESAKRMWNARRAKKLEQKRDL